MSLALYSFGLEFLKEETKVKWPQMEREKYIQCWMSRPLGSVDRDGMQYEINCRHPSRVEFIYFYSLLSLSLSLSQWFTQSDGTIHVHESTIYALVGSKIWFLLLV